MLNSPGTYLRLFVAGANILGLLLGTGVHLHILLPHEHEGDLAHRHILIVHSHAAPPDSPVETSLRQTNGEHRHHVPSIQIVAVHLAPIQTGSYVPEYLEFYSVSSTAPDPDREISPWISFTDTSPPPEQPLTESISDRSPPLA
jgi:hypothetical protein